MNPRIKRVLALAFTLLAGSMLLLSSSLKVRASEGDLDPTFNPGSGTNGDVQAIALQSDGRIIIGGSFSIYNGAARQNIARLNPDGSLDASFNASSGSNSFINALLIQPDGKIIICGGFTTYKGISRNGIARLHADGSLDTTFDPGAGAADRSFGGIVLAMALQSDGKIVIAGRFTHYNAVARNSMARLNPDGSLDTSFEPRAGDSSSVETNIIHSVAVQPDGKIVSSSHTFNFDTTSVNRIIRFNSDGTLDASFNSGIGTKGAIYRVAVQPEGQIIIGGFFTGGYNGAPCTSIARLNSDGSLDPAFKPNTDGSIGASAFVQSIIRLANGKLIIAGGFESYAGAPRGRIARLNSDGTLDPSFNPGFGAAGNIYAAIRQPDNKVIIGGNFFSYDGVLRRGITRLSADPSGGFLFSAPSYTVDENGQRVVMTVNRPGDVSQAAAIGYATSDDARLTPCNGGNGIASQRCDYQAVVGTLRFAPGEFSKTINVPIVDDGHIEGLEQFNVRLFNPADTAQNPLTMTTVIILDNDVSGAPNPVDDNAFFVRQLYLDFLNREPDPAGFAGWLNTLNNCNGNVAQSCDRVEVASAFFRSAEFQERGYFIYRIYRAGLGKVARYSDFIPDMARVSGFLNAQELEANKAAFVQEFVNRPEFQAKYGSLSDSAYVNALEATAQVTLPGKQALIDDLQAGRKSRAEVFRAVSETGEVYARYYNEAFVVMEYFGFLRRDPDAAYLEWINILNQTNNYRSLIQGFVNSAEYRQRFGL